MRSFRKLRSRAKRLICGPDRKRAPAPNWTVKRSNQELRIAFLRPGQPIFSYDWKSQYTAPTPPPLPRSPEDIMEFSSGENIGNFVHWEALSSLLDRRTAEASFLNLGELSHNHSATEISNHINANYDFVVFSSANFLRSRITLGGVGDILAGVKSRIILVGAGLQNERGLRLRDLSEDVRKLLDVVNERAVIFGTRGHTTANWLRKQGFKNAAALGCPSVYAGLDGVRRLNYVDPEEAKRVITAGRLRASGPGKRFEKLSSGLQARFDAQFEYVIQSEFESLPIEQMTEMAIDSRGKVCKEYIRRVYFGDDANFTPPKKMDFWAFLQIPAWRQFVSTADMYFGDRVHGGIICLQAGIPAVLLYEDDRVREIAEFYAIPAFPLEKASEADSLSNVYNQEAIATMKSTAHKNFLAFAERCKDVGFPIDPRLVEAAK